MNVDQALEILRTGLVTFDEQQDVAKLITELRTDAERYRWLKKYTAHLFMCTDKQLDEQMNRAMHRGE